MRSTPPPSPAPSSTPTTRRSPRTSSSPTRGFLASASPRTGRPGHIEEEKTAERSAVFSHLRLRARKFQSSAIGKFPPLLRLCSRDLRNQPRRAGMTETTDLGREHAVPRLPGEGGGLSAVEDWFVREVLPLEAVLMQFLRRHCREKADADDLCQDIYVRVYEAAHNEIPASPRAFVFTTSRNLLVDRIRKRQVVPMATMADLDALHIANDDPGPERAAIASDTLRRLQAA